MGSAIAVGIGGFEPSRIAPSGPKPGASTNFAICPRAAPVEPSPYYGKEQPPVPDRPCASKGSAPFKTREKIRIFPRRSKETALSPAKTATQCVPTREGRLPFYLSFASLPQISFYPKSHSLTHVSFYSKMNTPRPEKVSRNSILRVMGLVTLLVVSSGR